MKKYEKDQVGTMLSILKDGRVLVLQKLSFLKNYNSQQRSRNVQKSDDGGIKKVLVFLSNRLLDYPKGGITENFRIGFPEKF